MLWEEDGYVEIGGEDESFHGLAYGGHLLMLSNSIISPRMVGVRTLESVLEV